MEQTQWLSRVTVSLLFVLLYLAFLTETALLFIEFSSSGLAWSVATLDSQNFIFFPVAGLLALVAFWQPTVYVFDCLGGGKVPFGRPVLGVSLGLCVVFALTFAASFNTSSSRSVFEIAPPALLEDTGQAATSDQTARASIPDILTRMRILAADEGGLTAYRGRCDTDWLTYADSADRQSLCFPAGERISMADCCQAKRAFRAHLIQLHADSPSQLSYVHKLILPIKGFFLLFLLMIGVLLVQYRKALSATYGDAFTRVSFALAVGGIVMLIWPLLNASYLDTMALLTGGTARSTYAITAPLIALGFGAWALLLTFFHFRSYPSQIESAARVGGLIVAVLGVLRYEEITTYISRTLGVGGSVVAVIVFAVAVIGLIASILTGAESRLSASLNASAESDTSD